MNQDPGEVPADLLAKAISALKPLEREALLLSATFDLTNEEVAATLGIRERAAERLLAEALRKVDRFMERR